MKLSQDQQQALDKLLAWHDDPAKKQFMTLGGYAGTGKTTLISVFKNRLTKAHKNTSIAFCSYTGRAAQNLRNKLREADALAPKDTISTIHALIYTPLENSKGEITGWARKDGLAKDLVIVDEASMVDEAIWRDLLSFEIPILAVGDHGQLPPINGNFNLMRSPEIVLTEIHRQARDNPIITISEHARRTGLVPPKRYGPGAVKYLRHDEDSLERSGELLEAYCADTMILCGYNSTRNKINSFIRASLGYDSPEPGNGDRVICLRNNHKKAIYNGMLGTIAHIERSYKDWYNAEIDMDDASKPYSGLIYAPQFGAGAGVNFTKDRRLAARGDLFDFGYALTVHKAQGSQAKRVVMFEERFPKMDDEMWRRWLYTGVTRAEEELYLFG
jgi:exodeoxyribonuclease-5